MKSTKDALLMLIRNQIVNAEITDELRADLADRDFLQKTLNLARFHDLSHIAANALLENGIITEEDDELYKKANKKIMTAIYRYDQLEFICDGVYELFEENKIAFIPLKGAYIRKLYPNPWMRTSCDADILIKQTDIDKAVGLLSEKMNGKATWFGNHDIPVTFNNDTHIELHFSFEDIKQNSRNVLSNVWQTALLSKGYKYRYEMRGDMFYFYHLAHMAKHIKNGGCGIKPFIDLFLIDKTVSRPTEEMLNMAGLSKFYESVKELAEAWLYGKSVEGDLALLEQYILKGGTYGTARNRSAAGEKTDKSGALGRAFLPADKLKYEYPALENNKLLYPFFIAKRISKLTFKTLPKILKKDAAAKNADEQTANMIKNIGL